MGYLQRDNNNVSLLYVEDEPVVRELIQKIISLQFPAMKIHTAENGKVGLELFKKASPDIVLTDIDLPMLDGISMLYEIRTINSETEIIILSGREKTLHDSDCVNIGISNYLQKPVPHEVLCGALKDSLDRVTL